MKIAHSLKGAALGLVRGSGVSGIVAGSGWRSKRLLILAYHGISFEDEHEWNPGLFIPQDLLRRRLEAIRRLRCNVLPLAEGIKRLYGGDLPPRSVVLTFDDGNTDFPALVYPLLQEFGFPATVYWTTYYSTYPRPVPTVACSYLLWKGRAKPLEWPGLWDGPLTLDDPGRRRAYAALLGHAEERGFDARQKDALLEELAGRLGLDYARFCRKRILQIMTGEEAAGMIRAGIDFQMHTHRHSTSPDRETLLRDAEDNRRVIEAAGAPRPRHFCYPSGIYSGVRRDWLAEAGLASAATCDPALAEARNDPFFLPRFCDGCACSDAAFESWLTGVQQFLPRRQPIPASMAQELR